MESGREEVSPLSELEVRPVERSEEERYQHQRAAHHYLGALPNIGETRFGTLRAGEANGLRS